MNIFRNQNIHLWGENAWRTKTFFMSKLFYHPKMIILTITILSAKKFIPEKQVYPKLINLRTRSLTLAGIQLSSGPKNVTLVTTGANGMTFVNLEFVLVAIRFSDWIFPCMKGSRKYFPVIENNTLNKLVWCRVQSGEHFKYTNPLLLSFTLQTQNVRQKRLICRTNCPTSATRTPTTRHTKTRNESHQFQQNAKQNCQTLRCERVSQNKLSQVF